MPSHVVVDRTAKHVVLICASASFVILGAIFIFTMREGAPALQEIGLYNFLLGTEWRPGQEMFGILPMTVGSILVTLGSMVLAIPIGLACAILLAEVASFRVRRLLRPAVELLVGIPSVVYGLVGMLLIVPAVREIGGSGFSILAASLVLTAMVLPTIISISEDSLRAVPKGYKEAALAMGATQWQMIWHVQVPAARSGIMAGIVLGMGRAIGETMAMIMVIGNSPIIPTSPLSQGRTLTGNIAVEIMYASGIHRSALFSTGVILFLIILVLNTVATFALRRGLKAHHVA
ncbi:MAG: phosphate ABC transporter permease subunit PstC [Dehalococcoidales bacterium]|jgi:phosphate transport system permease protein|nr:phosphate ABC transporter permease subunit PstC [Dehalococcoidales bacterium]